MAVYWARLISAIISLEAIDMKKEKAITIHILAPETYKIKVIIIENNVTTHPNYEFSEDWLDAITALLEQIKDTDRKEAS